MAQQPPSQALADAQTAWQDVFAGGPYTGLKMLQYLLTTGGKTNEAFLKKPKAELATVMPAVEANSITTLAPTWQHKTGRCTSMAVKVVHNLADKKVNGNMVYDWCIYDLGRHRIARCRKTGAVIDSSSTIPGGAFLLPEGRWQRFEETNASWKFESSKSMFESRGNAEGPVKSSATPISSQEAMVQCLREVSESASDSVPTLFRTMGTDHIGKFYGMIVWAPAAHAIKLARNSDAWRAKQIVTIQWAKYKTTKGGKPTEELETAMQGTQQDLETCLHTLNQWIVNYGGPGNNGVTQWAADGIDTFSLALIQTAVNLWGFPKLIQAS